MTKHHPELALKPAASCLLLLEPMGDQYITSSLLLKAVAASERITQELNALF